MASDKGSKRLFITYLGSFASEAQVQDAFQATRNLSSRTHTLSSLASIPSMNASARVIRIAGGFTLFQNPVLRDRSTLRIPRLPPQAMAVKVFY